MGSRKMSTLEKEYGTGIWNAESGNGDRIYVITGTEDIEAALDKDLDTEENFEDEVNDYGEIRIKIGDESSALYFLPDGELKDQKIRNEYQDELEPLYDLFGGEEHFETLLEQASGY